ncbi:arrestin domain-containing protein 3-like isoform X3 [Amblyraja radiata]|uniref:arrestin domain-containing protein 3-like isoform X3 n=1 Tax=Amblyraja radiata TaxID=386614 RepID=UPI001402DF45|nr:arrestin domain-containing protein 3-like isoform X3 [Amblyraja radiata]
MGRVKTLSIVYDRPTYSCGEWISGRIVMEITNRTEVRVLKIHAKGEAYVQWKNSSNSSDSNRSEDYPQQLRYFKHKYLLIGSDSSDEVTVLQEGIHEYPFSLVLPPTPPLPSSFKGTYGHVSYWMTAKLHRPLKLRIKTKEPFTVYNQVDINTPRLLEPHTAANEKTICCWCCASGPISLKAEVERMGYVAGESIKIFVEIENHSSRKVVPKAAIVKTIIFHAKTKKKTLSEVIIKTKGEPVLAGQKDSRNSMMLEIPELIPTLMNCSIIQMDYSIQVTVDIPRSMGLTVDLPIVIGTIPLHSYGGPASDFNNQYGMNYSNVNHGFPEGSAVEAGFQAANKSLGYYT